MRILQVSTYDIGGGAERVAYNLFHGYRDRGLDSWLVVGQKRGNDPDVFVIPGDTLRYGGIWSGFWHSIDERLRPYHYQIRGTSRLSQTAQALAEPVRFFERQRGIEDFHFPGTSRLLDLPPSPPDILHCHNLHGAYFDLRELVNLSRRLPVVFTLHDAWLLSGHCSHSFGCDRWKTGCGNCPDLEIYPRVLRDATAYNWRRKHKIYAQSRFYVSTPSRWLMEKVEQSMLMQAAVEMKIIPYGVDLNIFTPGDKTAARVILNLPDDAVIFLFSAASIRKNQFKDYAIMRTAMQNVAQQKLDRQVIFLALGEDAPTEKISEQVEIRFLPYQSDLQAIARFYQAADVYLHAARADTFPNAVLEALACGIPVVGSAVGGIPEQVIENETGFLLPVGDAEGMSTAITRLLENPAMREKMGQCAADDARQRFDLNDQIQTHLDWYTEILKKRETH